MLNLGLVRIAKTAWLREEEHEHVGHVYTRTNQLTGLNMETSEELQVSNYGIGGHYEPHFDFSPEKNAFSYMGAGKSVDITIVTRSLALTFNLFLFFLRRREG